MDLLSNHLVEGPAEIYINEASIKSASGDPGRLVYLTISLLSISATRSILSNTARRWEGISALVWDTTWWQFILFAHRANVPALPAILWRALSGVQWERPINVPLAGCASLTYSR